MKKHLLALALSLMSALVFAGETAYPLADVTFDPTDKPSLQHGAQVFMNYCSGCHSLKYERYERLHTGLGIPEDMVMKYLRFDRNKKIDDLMTNAMPAADAKKWFGAAPPDLTLEARVHSPRWIYTYLLTFYKDPSRPWGVNNKVFPNVGMPDVMYGLQGLQECAPGPAKGESAHRDPCGHLKLVVPGKLTPQQYRKTVYDLANFLDYIAEPMQVERRHVGVFVLLYLGVLFVFASLLNREYWKDVH